MQNLRGPGLIVLAAFLWGLDGILRRSLYGLSPILIVLLEHVIGFIIILPFFLRSIRKESFTRKEWGALFVVALFSSVLGTLWFTTALLRSNYIPFSVVFLLQKLQPVFAVGAASLFLRERLTRRYFAWAAVAVIAAYFVTFPGGLVVFGSGALAAALFALAAAFAWGSTTALSRYALLKHSPTSVTGIRFGLAAIFALIIAAVSPGLGSLSMVGGKEIGTLAAIALSTGMVALWLYYNGLKSTRVGIATILELVFPLTAVVIDATVYGVILSPSQYVAGAVLLFAAGKVAKENS